MTADDLTRLRDVAEAATPGPWEVFNPLGDADQFNDVLCVKNGKQVACECDTEDAEFIATFDPPTVAALIDRVERAERERDDLLQTEVNTWIENDQISFARATRLDDEITALRAAVEGKADEWQRVIKYRDHSAELRALLDRPAAAEGNEDE